MNTNWLYHYLMIISTINTLYQTCKLLDCVKIIRMSVLINDDDDDGKDDRGQRKLSKLLKVIIM